MRSGSQNTIEKTTIRRLDYIVE